MTTKVKIGEKCDWRDLGLLSLVLSEYDYGTLYLVIRSNGAPHIVNLETGRCYTGIGSNLDKKVIYLGKLNLSSITDEIKYDDFKKV